MKTPIEMIAAERERQKTVEEYSEEHDDAHQYGDLAQAAACYAWHSDDNVSEITDIPHLWPWGSEFWKPTPDDRIRELVKAGALIVAEIERLQRASRSNTSMDHSEK